MPFACCFWSGISAAVPMVVTSTFTAMTSRYGLQPWKPQIHSLPSDQPWFFTPLSSPAEAVVHHSISNTSLNCSVVAAISIHSASTQHGSCRSLAWVASSPLSCTMTGRALVHRPSGTGSFGEVFLVGLMSDRS